MAGRAGKKGAVNSEVKPSVKKRDVAKAVVSHAANEQLKAKKRIARSVTKTAPLKKPGAGKHVHELQVRQAELERQNEDLRRAQGQLQASEHRYFDLYDIAPVGYFSISEKGIILEVNITGANLLGAVPSDLRAQRFVNFIYAEDQDIYNQHRSQLFETRLPQACEIRVVRKDGAPVWVQVEAIVAKDAKSSKLVCLATMSDITRQKKAEELLRNERNLAQNYLDTVQTIIVALDTEGRITTINRKGCQLFGRREYELIGQIWFSTCLPQPYGMENVYPIFSKLISGELEAVEYFENPIVTRSGEIRQIAWHNALLRDEKGRITGTLSSGEDITERKKMEEALQESEALYQLLADNTADGIWLLDMNLKLIYCSPSSQKQSGFTVQEIMEMPLEQYFTPESLKVVSAAFLEEIPRVQANPEYNPTLTLELEFYKKDGTAFWAESKFSIIRDNSGKPESILGVARDITERRKIDKLLRSSEAQYRLLSEHTTDTVWLVDMNMKTTYTSPSSEKLLGFTHQELMQMPAEKYLAPDSLRLAIDTFWKELPRVESDPDYNPVFTLELEYYRKDGTTLWAENKLSMIRDENGKPVSVLGETRDINERKRAQKALRESEEKYRNLFDNAGEAIYVAQGGNLVFLNPRTSSLIGYSPEEIMQRQFIEFIHEEDREMVIDRHIRRLKGEVLPDRYEFRIIHKNGATKWVALSTVVISWESKPATLNFLEDITARKHTEEKLVQSYESLKKTLNDAINTMVKIVEIRDPYTAGHQQKVADLATAIARAMKLDDTRIDQLRMAAVTHDIGKMYVPSDILSKPGRLSKIEFSLIKTHSLSGYNIVKGMDFPCSVADAVLQHHERLDGSGYPSGLKGEDMILEAKILAVADVIEAMASHRPYRSALGIDKALEEISDNRGKLYDPDVVDVCLELFRSGQFEFKSA